MQNNEEAFKQVIEQTRYFLNHLLTSTPPDRSTNARFIYKELIGYIDSFLDNRGFEYKNNVVRKKRDRE